MPDPWLIALAAGSALFVSGLVLWRRLSKRPKKMLVREIPADLELILPSEPSIPYADPAQEQPLLRQVVILFGPESAALSPAAIAALEEAARRLTERPELTVTVEGSADSLGNASRNLVLARDRAWAARQFLLGRGIGPDRIRSLVLPPRAGGTEYERQRLRSVRLTWKV